MKKEFQLFFRHVRMKKAFIHFHYPCFTFPLADLRSIALSTTFLLLFGSFPSPTQIRSKALSTFPIKLTSAAVTFSLPVCVTKCRSGVSSNPILRSHLFSEKSAALGHFAPFWKVVEYFNGTFWRARWSVFRKDTHFPIFFSQEKYNSGKNNPERWWEKVTTIPLLSARGFHEGWWLSFVVSSFYNLRTTPESHFLELPVNGVWHAET